ncbi:NAD-dependent malic enzyme, partial [Staphylococcus felis]|nr:NAD-dependent malic enzyme [Staphylococcus felis]
ASVIDIVKLLYSYVVRNMIMCYSKGAFFEGRSYGMNKTKETVAKWTNKDKVEGKHVDVVQESDVFIVVSVANALTEDMV